mmetsp:Transcript_41091/g.46691  ORF Transcript_41091/g.46691 Transcript_41091/m.46691 type:complete len:325 (-) Transcript_41091:103-1077(-)
MTIHPTEAAVLIGLVLACFFQYSYAHIVAGYLPEYRSNININNTSALLTDLILFSLDPGADGILEGRCCLKDSHYKLAREARSHRKKSSSRPLKLWVTIGGVGRSESFLAISKSGTKRDQFLSNLVQLCKRESLNGVDIDWQGLRNEDEYKLFIELILSTAKMLHKSGLLISVTTRERLPSHVLEEIDRVQFMGYDLLFDKGPKHHASYSIVTQIVEQWLDWNYPEEKIVLGIPGYGRHKDSPSQIKTFAELIDDGLDDETTNEWNGYLFDSPALIRKKVKFVKQNDLAGVVLWELGHDKQDKNKPGGWLVNAMANQKVPEDEF